MPTISSFRIITLLGIATIAFASGWFVNGLIWERRSDELLDAQKLRLMTECNDQKKITEEASNDYQKNRRIAGNRTADLKRMYANSTVPVTGKADGSHAAAGGTVDARPAGVAAESLIELAGECEVYRQQVIGLQGFINRVWEPR